MSYDSLSQHDGEIDGDHLPQHDDRDNDTEQAEVDETPHDSARVDSVPTAAAAPTNGGDADIPIRHTDAQGGAGDHASTPRDSDADAGADESRAGDAGLRLGKTKLTPAQVREADDDGDDDDDEDADDIPASVADVEAQKQQKEAKKAGDEADADKDDDDADKDDDDADKDDDDDNDEDPDSEDEEEYQVERILAHRKSARGILYKIKWEGYAESECTWEPEEHLLPHCRDALASYFADKGGEDKVKSRPRRTKAGSPAASSSSPYPKRSTKSRQSSTDAQQPQAKRRKGSAAAEEASEQLDHHHHHHQQQQHHHHHQQQQHHHHHQQQHHHHHHHHNKDSSRNTTDKKVKLWTPKQHDWTPEVEKIELIERDESGQLQVYIRFTHNRAAKVSMDAVRKHCPVPMLDFFQAHLKFKVDGTSDGDGGESEAEAGVKIIDDDDG